MSLIEDARAAKEAGLSYGQYMLQNKPFIRYHREPGKRCVVCGGVLSASQHPFLLANELRLDIIRVPEED